MVATTATTAGVLPDAPLLDVARFYALTEDLRERVELIEGEVHVVPAPSLAHQSVVTRLTARLQVWSEAAPDRGLVSTAPTDVLVEGSVLQPDVMWWRTPPDLQAQPSPPPDLAVEVLSPATRRHDVERKRRLYARAEVAEVWLVDPEQRRLTALRAPDRALGDYAERLAPGGAGTYATLLLPGLELAVAPLFPA